MCVQKEFYRTLLLCYIKCEILLRKMNINSGQMQQHQHYHHHHHHQQQHYQQQQQQQ